MLGTERQDAVLRSAVECQCASVRIDADADWAGVLGIAKEQPGIRPSMRRKRPLTCSMPRLERRVGFGCTVRAKTGVVAGASLARSKIKYPVLSFLHTQACKHEACTPRLGIPQHRCTDD